MKKIMTFIAICLIVCTTIIMSLTIYDNLNQNNLDSKFYPTTAIVDRLEDNDKVVCVDCNENVWVFDGVEDWQEGDIVAMIMDTRGTVTIYDDKIIDVRYCGSVKGL